MSTRALASSMILIVAAASSAAAQQSLMPSLAEVARQAEAAQPTKARARKSYTNADLHGSAEAPPSVAEPPAGVVSATTGKAMTADEMVKAGEEKVDAASGHTLPEEHWRQRADFIRSQVDKAHAELTRLNIPVPGRSEILEALNANEIKKNQQMLDGAMKQWAVLEESARVAKAPAGWIEPSPAQK